ncbi:MAG: PAS domain-containing sensor histidine kinase [Chitinophagia bacterium]|nr:PAS domain-containing sensor histidine kinase [Chitinophagia bacterium]
MESVNNLQRQHTHVNALSNIPPLEIFPDELSSVFPYFLLINQRGLIVRSGHRLKQLGVMLTGQSLYTSFTINGKAAHDFLLEDIPVDLPLKLTKTVGTQLEMKGCFHWIANEQYLLFTGGEPTLDNKNKFIVASHNNEIEQIDEVFSKNLCWKYNSIADLQLFAKQGFNKELLPYIQRYAVTLSGSQGKVFWCNDGFTRLTQFDKTEVIGRRPRECMYGQRSARIDPNYVDNKVKDAQPFYFENIGYRKDGSEYWFGVMVVPLLSTTGEIIGRLHCIKDITKAKVQSLVLSERDNILELAVDATQTITWLMDFTDHSLHFADEVAQHFDPAVLDQFRYYIEREADNWHAHTAPFTQVQEQLSVQGNNQQTYYFQLHSKCIEWDTLQRPIKFVGVFTNVTTHYQQLLLLEQKNAALEKSYREMEKFVYSVSHNLRAPLVSTLSFLEMLQRGELSQEEASEYYTVATSLLRNMDDTIFDMVEYYKNKTYKLDYTVVPLERLVNNTFHELKYLQQHPVAFKCTVLGAVLLVTDQKMMYNLLQNILSNALKYCDGQKADSWIDVQATITAQECTIVIADNGIGMDPVVLDKIFNLYFRATSQSIGTGLGLSIVKDSVDKLEGTIEVSSHPGAGSTFTITFPNKLKEYSKNQKVAVR